LKLSFFAYRHLYYGITMLFSVMNGLKEDTLVDIPDTHTLPQLILIMSLFILLIGWLVIFAYLALRPAPEKRTEQIEHTAALPAVKSPIVQTLPITPRASSIRTITQPTPIVTVSTDSTHEIVLDHSTH
jgi:hypothetical protein